VCSHNYGGVLCAGNRRSQRKARRTRGHSRIPLPCFRGQDL